MKSKTDGDVYNISSPVLGPSFESITTPSLDIGQKSCIEFEEDIDLMPEKVRQIMRHIPQSIAILTTSIQPTPELQSTKNSRGNTDTPITTNGTGITLSSVSTVAIKPEPIISFNIKKPSHTLDALRYHGNFLIHFPSCSYAGALLADRFSRGAGNYQSNPQAQENARKNFAESSPLFVLNIKGQKISLPALLPPAYPINFILKCETYNGTNGYIDVADHVIIVGKVQKTLCVTKPLNHESTSSSHEMDTGLAYLDGAYCFTGSKLSQHENSR